MKNKDEYLESIYSKRDKKIRERKKTVSVLTSIFCITICFAAVFAFVPKYFKKESPAKKNETGNSDNHIISNADSSDVLTTMNEEFFASGEQYAVIQGYNQELITDDAGNRNMNDSQIKASQKNYSTTSENKLQTEIAAEIPDEETTRRMGFGYIGEPFDESLLPTKSPLAGSVAIAPAKPPEDSGTEVTEPYFEAPDSIDSDETKASTTAAKLKSAEEATSEAKSFLSTELKEDAEKIIDEKTQVTVTRTANGKTTYTVYLYTNTKSFEIDVDAVTLRILGCKQKYLVSGYETYISPPHFPETTAALPEYKPQ